MATPGDYVERVYAGVLGKLIGVYLGRPFEGWTYERIMAELGEVDTYVHERFGMPLIVTDDDISGTFTFLRALDDYGTGRSITPRQIGQTWLNYIIEDRTILWWGGLGNSTEHTAYLRLKSGMHAPASGAIATNGKTAAEQIGAQIFIDGWAMVAPGDPELAVTLAAKAGSVSHDGEAIYAAQVVAAMEAQAFVEHDLNALLAVAVSFIPPDSTIARMIADIREWHTGEPDWHRNRARVAAKYGYDTYPGNCHAVPNHALIVLALLHGDDDLRRSLAIVNTSGWDTDCNSGNVGCLLGIKNGLAGLESSVDFRGPVADLMYLATADGGRAITDALTEAYHVVNLGRSLAGEPPLRPKNGARFHFSGPGSVQGWQADEHLQGSGVLTLDNVAGHSQSGLRSLALRFTDLAHGDGVSASTATFIPPETIHMPGYRLMASPTLYPGQTVHARVEADSGNDAAVECALFIRTYNGTDDLDIRRGPVATLAPGAEHRVSWPIPDTDGQPVAQIGIEIRSTDAAAGTLYLDELGWDGAPDVVLKRPSEGGMMWCRAWVDGVDLFEGWSPQTYRLAQNHGTGLLIQGTREWTDYQVSVAIVPSLVRSCGVAARVQGMARYYALLLSPGNTARLVKARDGQTVLAEADYPWQFGDRYEIVLIVEGDRIRAKIDGNQLFDVADARQPLTGGGVAFVVEEGCVDGGDVWVQPVHR